MDDMGAISLLQVTIIKVYTMKYFISFVKTLLFTILADKKTKVSADDVDEIILSREQLLKLYKTSSRVLKTSYGFFRPCPSHIDFKAYLEKQGIWYKRIIDLTKMSESDINYFIKSEKSYYQRHHYRNSPQTFSANRIMGTETIARLLSIENLTPHTQFVNLCVDNLPPMFGTLMEFSKGVYPLKLGEELKTRIKPSVQRHLVNLNVLDSICYEKDHRPGNYNIIQDNNGDVVDICAFDNDCQWTFFPSFTPNFKSYAGSSHLIKGKLFNRPFLDRKLFDRIENLTRSNLYDSLESYLNVLQIEACWWRIQKIRNSLKRALTIGRLRLLDDEEWNEDTMKDELNGKYGNTYLCILYNWYETCLKKYPNVFERNNFNLYEDA